MKMLVKSAISIMLNVALLLAFLQAPSLHVHAHEATQRHAGTFFHTHFAHGVHPPLRGAEWRDLDPADDARFLSWVSMVPSDNGLAPAVLAASTVILPIRVVTEWQTTILRPRAHDPPALSAAPPRAPPA
jgi:hypothetical protein